MIAPPPDFSASKTAPPQKKTNKNKTTHQQTTKRSPCLTLPEFNSSLLARHINATTVTNFGRTLLRAQTRWCGRLAGSGEPGTTARSTRGTLARDASIEKTRATQTRMLLTNRISKKAQGAVYRALGLPGLRRQHSLGHNGNLGDESGHIPATPEFPREVRACASQPRDK